MSTNEPSPREPADEWWATHPAHPCAAVFPLLTGEPFVEFVNDIKLHGLREPIALYTPLDDTTAYVLDGRNRANALLHLGRDPDEHTIDIPPTVDPASYVISRNLRRRHLTKEEQARLIVQAVDAAHRNDRATMARSFSPEPGKKGGSTKNPVLNAAVREAEKHDISKRTVQRAFTTIRHSRLPLSPAMQIEKEKLKATRAKLKTEEAAWERLRNHNPVAAAIAYNADLSAFQRPERWKHLRKALAALETLTSPEALAFVAEIANPLVDFTDDKDDSDYVPMTKVRAVLKQLATHTDGEKALRALLTEADAEAVLPA